MDELDPIGQRSARAVVDLDSPRRTCPACFHEYDAGPTSCPDCGLFLGA